MAETRNHQPEIEHLTGQEPEYVASFDALVERNLFHDPSEHSELAIANPDILISFGENRELGYYVAFRFKREFRAGKTMPWHNELVASHRICFRINDEGKLLRTIEMAARVAGEVEQRSIGRKLGKNNAEALVECLTTQPEQLTEVLVELCQLSNRDISRIAKAHHEIKQAIAESNGDIPTD